MTDWIPQIAARPGPRYRAIVQALSDGISRGRLKPGDRLPTQRELAKRLGVTLGTVTRAYSDAEAEGLIQGQVGRGTFVTARGSAEGGRPLETPPDFLGHGALPGPFVDGFERALVAAAGKRAPGSPRETDAERSFQNSAATFAHATFGVKASPDLLLGLSGAAASFAALLPALTPPPAPVLASEMTDDAFLAAARALGYEVHPVVEDEQGVLPESLELACWSSRAGILFASADGGIPLGRVVTNERRRSVVEIARKYDLWIVEDRTGAPFVEGAVQSLAAMAPERTVALVHLQRCLYPDLNLTLALSAPDCAAAIRTHALAIGAIAPRIPCDAFAAWFEDGTAAEALSWQTEQAKRRQVLFRRHLQGSVADGRIGGAEYLGWLKPRGARAVAAIEEALRQAGAFRVLKGDRFWAGKGAPPRRLMIGLSAIEGLTALERHLPRLGDALAKASGDPAEQL